MSNPADEAQPKTDARPVESGPIVEDGRTRREGPGLGRWIVETVVMVALAFALAQGIKTFVVQPFVIPTGSMEPTILVGDRVLAEKITYLFSPPSAGDIVVFDDPAGMYPQLIKRIVAVGGQTIDIRDGAVFIDGALLEEPYTAAAMTELAGQSLPITIPEDYVWLMGDNRPNSSDSRIFGPQPVESIGGRAVAIYWPPSRIGGL